MPANGIKVRITRTITIQLYRGEGKSCEKQLIYKKKLRVLDEMAAHTSKAGRKPNG